MKVIRNIREDKGLEVSYEWIEFNQKFNQIRFDQIEFDLAEYS